MQAICDKKFLDFIALHYGTEIFFFRIIRQTAKHAMGILLPPLVSYFKRTIFIRFRTGLVMPIVAL